MQNYHHLLAKIMAQGKDKKNKRTGIVCRTLVGEQLRYDLRQGFPAITTKKLAFRASTGEMMGFFRGYDSAADFRKLGCGVWDANANETPDWLANPYRGDKLDFLGRIYGCQWTKWLDRRITKNSSETQRLEHLGYRVVMKDDRRGLCLLEREINQLEDALTKLLTDPSDRRIIISGWNVAELDMMALPPCHMDYRFVCLDGDAEDAPKRLSLVFTMRSMDAFLGAPFNLCGAGFFLEAMARLSGCEAHELVLQITNAHIYSSHFDQVREQLGREHYPAPRLLWSDRVRKVDINEVRGAFERIEPADISLGGYQSHPSIKAPMAV